MLQPKRSIYHDREQLSKLSSCFWVYHTALAVAGFLLRLFGQQQKHGPDDGENEIVNVAARTQSCRQLRFEGHKWRGFARVCFLVQGVGAPGGQVANLQQARPALCNCSCTDFEDLSTVPFH